MTGNSKILAASALAAFTLLGCDSAPGAEDPHAQPPVVSNLVYSPGVIQIDQLPREGETVVVGMNISAAAFDPDGDLAGVSYVIQSPVGAAEPIASGEMTAGNGGFSAQVDVPFPVALTGSYVLVVYAEDARGYLGNEVRGTIELTATSNPPVIDEVEMPDRIARPAAGEPAVTLQLVAVVSDPDGLANVARVEVRFDGGTPLLLCDDGGLAACNPGSGSGDAVAGDGRFTLTIQVASTNSPGPRTLEFVAIDRSGLMSEPVTRVLTLD